MVGNQSAAKIIGDIKKLLVGVVKSRDLSSRGSALNIKQLTTACIPAPGDPTSPSVFH